MAVTARMKDPTSALRVRRHRAKKKLNGGQRGVDGCAALRAGDHARNVLPWPPAWGMAWRRLVIYSRRSGLWFIMALVDRLPPDSTLNVPFANSAETSSPSITKSDA
jgi:hypothetical protein